MNSRSQTREAIGARLAYLRPYRPDFNPIEQLFDKLKWLVRNAEERTVDGLWNLRGPHLDRFPPHECENYFRNPGHATA